MTTNCNVTKCHIFQDKGSSLQTQVNQKQSSALQAKTTAALQTTGAAIAGALQDL